MRETKKVMQVGISHLKSKELAARWGCSAESIRSWTRSGKIKGFRIGRCWLYPVEMVEDYERKLLGKGLK